MFRSVSLLISLLTVLGLATPLLAQRTVRVGVGVVPALYRTIDLGVEVSNGKNAEFFAQLGYMPDKNENVVYPRYGSVKYKKNGGYLKAGSRWTTDRRRTVRAFAGLHLTGSLVSQNDMRESFAICDFYCVHYYQNYPSITSAQANVPLFGVGGSAGISVQIMKRLEVDLGVELNKILSGEERLLQPDAYKPGIGSTPFQALLNVQYRIK